MLTRTRRFLGLILALAYLATPAGVFAARVCPHHDAAPGTDAQAEHAHHDAADSTSSTSESDAADTCNCLGACAISSPAALSHGAVSVHADLSAVVFAPAHADASAPRDARIPYLLPFANAPPQSSLHS